MKILWGDLHNHCGISYGFGKLEYALQAAKLQLDFCAITGHAMWPDMYEKNEDTAFVVDFHEKGFRKLREHWEEVRTMIAEANSEELVTFQAYEMHSCLYGDHHIVSKSDELPLIYRDSPEELMRDCGVEAIVIPHHIGYTPGYRGINWDKFKEEISPVVEVYSKHGCGMSETAVFPYYHDMGPRDSRNTVYEGLKKGKKFSFVGSTDHHAGFPGSYGDGMVAVLAEEKTRDSIFEALKAGRTYAVTGDKIECSFQINGAEMGAKLQASERRISYDIRTEYALDKIVLYKNLKPLHILNGEFFSEVCEQGKYKLRIEMGWGNQDELFTWNGRVKTIGGSIVSCHTYFRGRNVLAPSETEQYDVDDVNRIANKVERMSESEVTWQCETVKNKSTLHPMTDHIVFEIDGSLDTEVVICVNGQEEVHTVAELLESGYSAHMKPYHSQAYKVHQMLPETQYHFQLELEDKQAESDCDIYHVEVVQKNGQCAFVSPIFVTK